MAIQLSPAAMAEVKPDQVQISRPESAVSDRKLLPEDARIGTIRLAIDEKNRHRRSHFELWWIGDRDQRPKLGIFRWADAGLF